MKEKNFFSTKKCHILTTKFLRAQPERFQSTNSGSKCNILCLSFIARTIAASAIYSAPINSRLNAVVRSPTPFGLGRNGCWLSRVSQLPWALLYIFSLCCPLNDRSRAAHSIYKIGRLFSLFPLSCPSSSPHSFSSPDER